MESKPFNHFTRLYIDLIFLSQLLFAGKPGRCQGGPRLEDEGRNYVTIAWDRPLDVGSSSVVLYKLETWTDGHWKQVGVTSHIHEDVFNLEGERRFRVSAGNCHGWGDPVEAVLDIPVTATTLPHFSSPLKGQLSAAPGDNISLVCQAEGYPKPVLSWFKNGEDLGINGHRLDLEHLTEGGLYTCEAKNSLGRVSTHTYITLVPSGSPLPPRHQVSNCSCSCIALEESVLLLSNIATLFCPTDTDCSLEGYAPPQATIPYRRTDYANTKLLPPEGEHGPEIVYPLKDRDIELGELVRLTLEVVGEPKPTVEWQKDGQLLQSGEFRTFSEGNFHTLEFTGTSGSDGRYTARALGLGVAVSSAVVTVHERNPCAFSLPLEPYVRARLGGYVRFTAKLAPHLRLAKVTWSRDGVGLVQSRNCVMTHSAGGEVTLELGHVTPRVAGRYSCTARVKGGLEAETSSQLQLFSEPPPPLPPYISIPYSKKPLFITKPRSIDVLEGDTVILKCEVVGDPNPVVSWLRDNLKVSRYSRDCGEFRERRSGPESSLEIRQAKLDYTGTYTALATNTHGETAAVLTLQVFARGQGKAVKSSESGVLETDADSLPLVSRPLGDTTVAAGEPLVLQCRIKAEPPPIVIWTNNGKLVRKGRISLERETACLEIENPVAQDGGVYTCTATNPLGTASTSAFVHIESNGESSESKSISPCVTRCAADKEADHKRHRLPSAPRLLSVPHSLVVLEGDEIRLRCSVSGWPEPHTDWRGPGSCWKTYEEGWDRLLVIPSARQEHSGTYTVRASNTRGSVEASALVQVIGRKDSRGRRVVAVDPKGKQHYSNMWETTPAGHVKPSALQMHQQSLMEAKLLERGLPESVTAVEGKPLQVSVTVLSEDTRVRWEKEGVVLPNCADLEQTSAGRCHTLRIRDVFLQDAGVYSCRAVSGQGHQLSSTRLQVTEDIGREKGACLVRPPQDTTALRGSRAVLQGLYTGQPQPAVIWSKGGRRLSGGGRLTMTNADGVASLAIDPVIADDSGKYLVTVTNRLGTDTQFASLSVTGAPDPPAGRPSVSASSDGVTIAWSSPHYDGGAMITGYTIELSDDCKLWTTIAHCCDRLSETVRGLSPGSSYSFRVRSHNSHGPSDPGPPSHPFIVTHHDIIENKWETVQIEPGSVLETKYTIMEEVGKGKYGIVKRALESKTGEIRAAKYVRTVKRQDRENVTQEVDLMNSLRHPLLLRLIGAFDLPKDIVLILEYVSGGELFERVAADDFTLTERDCILFMRQICEAVAYMHSQSIVHLDLKPENIMCTSRSCHVIKIIDFGLAKRLSAENELKVMLGTPEFIPPEIINYEAVGFQSDMWSVGVIAYVLLSGLSPFMGDNDAETFANITRAAYDYDDEAFDNISEDAKDFISQLLIKRKEDRLTAEESLRHQWISQGDDTMSQVKLSTEKLKKYIIRRKWQKTGNAIRALGRMATLSRRNGSPNRSESPGGGGGCRARGFSERSDSGFSEAIPGQQATGLDTSIEEEDEETIPSKPGQSVTQTRLEEKNPSTEGVKPNGSVVLKTNKAVTKRAESKIPGAENIHKAFAFWHR